MALDVGAYFGLHTVLLSGLVGDAGRVYAFEPSPAVLHCLHKTVGQLDNTTRMPVALSAIRGSTSFVVPTEASLASFADWTDLPERSKKRCLVPVDRLDSLVLGGLVPRPDFFKCDVEGAETLVFRGAVSVLDHERAPVLLFEFNPAATRALGLDVRAAVSFVRELREPRYELVGLGVDAGLYPLESLPDHLINILAVPSARRGSL